MVTNNFFLNILIVLGVVLSGQRGLNWALIRFQVFFI